MAHKTPVSVSLNTALALGSLLSAGQALATDLPIADADCVPVFNGGNHCTSNALSFEAISIEPDRTHCNAAQCTFAKAVYPNVRPRLHNNVVTVSAQASNNQRSEGTAVSATDQAWIAFTRAISEIALPVPVLPHGLLIALCALGVGWLGLRRR